MKIKKVIWIAAILILCQFAVSEICEDIIPPETNCTMVTPSILCSDYNYTIINSTGNMVTQGNLTLLSSSVYYFNFTKSAGDYIITLCDGTTREVYVQHTQEEKSDMYIAILLWLGIMFVVFIALFFFLQPMAVKIFFFSMAMAIMLISVNIVNIIAVNNNLGSGLIAMTSSTFKVGMWTLYITITALVLFGIYRLLKYMADGVKSWKGNPRNGTRDKIV